MKMLLLFFLFLASAGLYAQQSSSREDVVEVKKGESRHGTLIGYRYGKVVTLVEADGEVVEIPWTNVRRISFRSISQEQADQYLPEEDTLVTVVPDRKWRHALTTWLGFATNTTNTGDPNFDFTDRKQFIGTGISYHLIRELGRIAVGVGPGYELMNAERKERLASLTGLINYRMGNGRVQPFFRFRGGVSLPVGHAIAPLEGRRVTPLVHPSFGLEVTPSPGHWSTLFLDIGYRFSQLAATTVNQNLEVVDRKAKYRRLTLSVGSNF